MEAISFEYSIKNIPIPSRKDYNRKLIEKTEHLCRRMCWKAYFYLHPEIRPQVKETYGFNSTRSPPQVQEPVRFEEKLLQMIKNTQFRETSCRFQQQLKQDIRNTINNSNDLLVPADKTNNYYRMDMPTYYKLLESSTTSNYRKIRSEEADRIVIESKEIAKSLDIDDRVKCTARKPPFVTLKDHKDNFINNPTCRLIKARAWKGKQADTR